MSGKYDEVDKILEIRILSDMGEQNSNKSQPDKESAEPESPSVLSKPKEKFNMPPFEVILIFILFLFQVGWSVSGFPPNIVLACLIWVAIIALLIHIFWKWEATANYVFSAKLLITVLGVALIVAFFWNPVIERYRIEYAPTPQPTPTNAVIKKQAIELSDKMNKFLSNRELNRPDIMSAGRTTEEWKEKNREIDRYDQQTKALFVQNYKVPYVTMLKELEKRGVQVKYTDEFDPTNFFSLRDTSVKLSQLATTLPDN